MMENSKFKQIAILNSKSGKTYDVHFSEEDKNVSIIGPIGDGAAGDVFSAYAESEEEAKKIAKKELEKDKY